MLKKKDLTPAEIGRGAMIAGFIAWMRMESAAIPENSDEMNHLIMRYLEFDRKATPAEWHEVLNFYIEHKEGK